MNSKALRSGLAPLYEYNGCIYVRCMIPSDPAFGGKHPQLAKGQIDEGYTSQESAIKEACEELGLVEDNIGAVDFLACYNKIDVYTTWVENPTVWNQPHWESKWSGWVNLDKNMHRIRYIQRNIFQDILEHARS